MQTIEVEVGNLITIIEEHVLYATLTSSTITYRERQLYSSINLYFIIVGLVKYIIKSKVDEELNHDLDYLLISIILNILTPTIEVAPRKN